ncbi:LOW QUALITY PROTEIN: hypothetical protein QYF61_023478 [Mycteria americana]|uniref:Uncharacterized protein n=1 Tax=Mycteria americana TaxID=33587 RepID=A0AAN7P318_MYCAM|nr:LOW QUALITY PROTEIN: hypothetical protein QYF61_023478 [Mycteria americana]
MTSYARNPRSPNYKRMEVEGEYIQKTLPELLAAAPDTVGLLGCERTLWAHVQLFVHRYPQVLFRRAALNHIIPQPVLKPRIAPTQDPALGLVEPHEVHTGPLLQLVQVPPNDIPSFWRVKCTTQLGAICKLAEGAFDLAVNVIDENIEQHWSQGAVDRYPLDATIQPIPYPLNSPPIKSVSFQFREKEVVEDKGPCQRLYGTFQPLFPKPVALHGVAVAQVQDLALGLVKPHTIDLSPSIQPVQVPLQSLPNLKQINTPTQLGVICKLTEGALDPFIQIIDKDIKQNCPQHRALGNTACDQPPSGANSIHHHSLGPDIQPVLYPAKSTPVQATSSQFLQENAVGNRVKGFTEV